MQIVIVSVYTRSYVYVCLNMIEQATNFQNHLNTEKHFLRRSPWKVHQQKILTEISVSIEWDILQFESASLTVSGHST